MDYGGFIAAIRREGAALVGAARRASLDAPVPSCPDWTVADLLAHVGRLHHWVADLVERRPDPPSTHWAKTDPPDPTALVGYEERGYRRMADALAGAGAEAPVWSWTTDQTARFWARRQAHELAVHRWDVQGASGGQEPIERELAVDGIQEVFDMLPFRRGADTMRGRGETIHLHCTDGDGEWLVTLGTDGVEVVREHAKGDVAARAGASDLLLLLWGRVPADRVEVLGDASLLERWHELATF